MYIGNVDRCCQQITHRPRLNVPAVSVCSIVTSASLYG